MRANDYTPTHPVIALALDNANGLTESPAYVRRIVRESHSSFLWGMRILPKRRRQAIHAVYAFSRVVDDIADGPDPPAAKQRALSQWHREVGRLFAGTPHHPLTKTLQHAVDDFQLPKEEFHALITGMETDASARVRMETTEDLLRYCRQVAGSVGVLCIHIFGLSQAPGPRFAVALGNALQITNILRDIKEDLALNRLYIPRDMLHAHGVDTEPLSTLLNPHRLSAACAELASVAQSYYAEAESLIRELGWWRTRPAVFMKAIYQATLDRLLVRGWTRWDVPVRPSRMDQVWLIVRHGLR